MFSIFKKERVDAKFIGTHYVEFVNKEPRRVRLPHRRCGCWYRLEHDHGVMVMCSFEYDAIDKEMATYVVFPHSLCKEN